MERSNKKTAIIDLKKELNMQQKLEALQEANEYMQRLIKGSCTTITYLKQGNLTEGYRLLSQIADGLEWLGDIFILTNDIQKEKVDANDLQEIINEIVDAMENEDTGLIADLIEYEMIAKVEGWIGQVNSTLKYYDN